MEKRTYIAIDLKSFYASLECVKKGLNPLTTNLVVADTSRTNKTICLAVSPSLKEFGVKGRPRLFDVEQIIKKVNDKRKKENDDKEFIGFSSDIEKLKNNKLLKVDYLIAKPSMASYIETSTKIYQIYLKYISKDDIHVYSIDEVFIDATSYIKLYKLNSFEFAKKLLKEVLKETGITATCGIGTNLFLAKVAMDIVAKHIKEDKEGVRIAYLDEQKYRQELWNHTPLTDFWRVGKGIQKRLKKYDINTMGDLARYSIKNEDILFKEFGINAELLIDHAWGYESTTMKDIKNYKSHDHSNSISQVLKRPYNYKEAELIVKEMADTLSLNLLDKKLFTNQVALLIDYDAKFDIENYDGDYVIDYVGRIKPKFSQGSLFINYTNNSKDIIDTFLTIYKEVVNTKLFIRRLSVAALNTIDMIHYNSIGSTQTSIFDNPKKDNKNAEKEKRIQKVRLDIMKKYGKNAILKVSSLTKESTQKERNSEIGGHKA